MAFEFGVAAGDLSASSVVLWTRVGPDEPIDWVVESSDGSRRGSTHADADGFVHVALGALDPGMPHRYRFHTEAGGPSPWGRFRTLPSNGGIRFAVASCAKFNSGYFNAYAAIAERSDLDFVLHLGDFIYEAGQIPRGRQTPGIDIGREFEPRHDCVTFDDYSTRYAQYRRDPALRALSEAHGLLFTLDDHEIADNAWSGGAEEHLPEDGPWANRLHGALAAWERWQPTTRRPTGGGPLWQQVRLGDVATLFLCETRLNRTDPNAPDGPGKSALGPTQRAELLAAAEAGDDWFVLGMPSKLLSLQAARGHSDTDLVLTTLKLSASDGSPFRDRWDSYAGEQSTIVDALGKGPRRTVALCGDVHFAAFSEHGSLAECVTSSVTSPNFDDKMGWSGTTKSRPYEEKLVGLVPEMAWCDLDRHGFLVVDITAEKFTCEWWGVASVVEPTSSATLLHTVTVHPTTH
ncbi:alkaline phosphatase D family protein [Gordonia crocea]|uniref:Alkaline phosphatase n=1 Tax=Gordonia crocea TaxID=589162 RepID=A0A7I9V196_9ACTN|nr:alkaline phosphatase D family protein [Gordonia crocea]GED98952.1 alkaline phosphatase [Gordonia crocea]